MRNLLADSWRSWRAAFAHSSPELAEFVSLIASLVWGCLLMSPAAPFGASATFRQFLWLSAGLEWPWGLACLTLASCIAFLRDSPIVRRRTMFASWVWWFLLSMLLLGGNPQSTAGYIYLLLPGALSLWAWRRLGGGQRGP